MSEQGYLTEIFSSIQGEGIYIGQRHTFVRFAGCNIHCAGCDTPAALEPKPERCACHGLAGETDFLDNPADVEDIVLWGHRLGNRVVALTGGEPLHQPDFAYRMLDALKNRGFSTYLETNGTLPDAYPLVAGMVDVVAMDIKLPSFTGLPPMWDIHAAFLHAARHDPVFVKVVVTGETTVEEVVTAARIVAGEKRDIPMVIQPASTREGEASLSRPCLTDYVIALQDAALGVCRDVRVIPQIHKLMGIR